MKIDLIIAIKEAYKKIYADKIKAKKLIKELNDLKLHFSYVSQVSAKIEENLSSIWKDLPIKQRRDYIQRTLDLLQHGFDVTYHEDGSRTYGGFCFGMTAFYKSLEDYVNEDIKRCRDYYLNHEYQMVESVYNKSITEINDRLVRYGILEVKKDDEGKTETI